MEGFTGLKGKTAVITGGAGVIGEALVNTLALTGVKTAIVDLNEERAKEVAASIASKTGNENIIGVGGNVLEKETLQKAKTQINEKLGTIDILINGAGGNAKAATTAYEKIDETNKNDLSGSFFGIDIDAFKKTLDLNLLGTVIPTMVFAEEMVQNGKGVILNISSMNSFRPLTKIPAYSAAKASINNFTEWLAVHFADTGIRVNAIAPGFFLTEQNRFLLTDEKTGKLTPRGELIISNTPMKRFGEPEELCDTMLYLLSDMSKFVTGVIIAVDGGFNAFSGV